MIVGSENAMVGGETAVVWSFTPPDLFTPSWLGSGGLAYDVTFDLASTWFAITVCSRRDRPGGTPWCRP